MALTLVSRETFQGVGTLTSASPGNLGAVTGTSGSGSFYKRAVGPRLTGDTTASSLGWSADLNLGISVNSVVTYQARHTYALSAGATRNAGMFSCWYYVDSLQASGANSGGFASTYAADTNNLLAVLTIPSLSGNFYYVRYGLWGSGTDSGQAIPIRQWFELRHSWVTSGGTISSLSADFRVAGSSTWNSIYTTTTSFSIGGTTLANVLGGIPNFSGSASYARCRYGMAALYTMDSWSDRLTAISDVVDPVSTGPYTWYVNPATGSDSNDGTSSSSAWQTITKINAESGSLGMFPTSLGYTSGDTLVIDTSGGDLVLGTDNFSIATRGLNITKPSGNTYARFKADVTVTGWSTTGTSNVYSVAMTNTGNTDLHICLWEDDKWMNHPTGANFAAVSASLSSTPGSFWTDGTTLYVHPFADTDPRSDGKVYTRSYNRAGTGGSAININAADVHINGLWCSKTCLVRSTDNDPIAAYCLQSPGSTVGTALIENCYFSYGSKHIVGFTDNSSNRNILIRDTQCEQGTPYSSYSTFVDYAADASKTGNVTTYLRCTNLKPVGLIGSTAGNPSGDSFITHNNGTGTQFATLTFDSCNFGGNIVASNSVNTMNITNTTCLSIGISPIIANISRCHITGGGIYGSAVTTLTARNCLINWTTSFHGSLASYRYVSGTLDIQYCTYDLTSISVTSTGEGLFNRSGSVNLTFKNNVVTFAPSQGLVMYQNFTSSDTINVSNNVFKLATGNPIASNYNDGSTTANRTFAQWQALSKDTNSLNTDPLLDSSYRPQSGSPVIDAGINLGPLEDYSGTVFAIRNDIGAYESLINAALMGGYYFG